MRRSRPSVNAGSMADIAFLLLIFFLITTTIQSEAGINRKLPPPKDDIPEGFILKRNLLVIELNSKDEIMINDTIRKLSELKRIAMNFIDNGADCNYCKGAKDAHMSIHPDKAIISLRSNRDTGYDAYINVQNELVGAYRQLRNRESMRLFNVSYDELKLQYSKTGDIAIKNKLKSIQEMYPEKISEAELKQ